jgi:glutathione S-transferase
MRDACAFFLTEKGVKLPTVEVDMLKGENKDPAYLSKNPMGTMPLLELRMRSDFRAEKRSGPVSSAQR